MRTVEYELMRPPEIAQARARLPLAFIPIGPLEWHGPHLPMGMDGLHAHTVAMEVARRVGGVVLPTYYLGSETVRPTDRGPQKIGRASCRESGEGGGVAVGVETRRG